jgi:hypothetical protein
MRPRPCLECGTPTTTGPRCPTHTRQRDAARGTRQTRGYGPEHQRARTELIALLPTMCGYGCGTLLVTPQQLIAAHRVDGHPQYGWLPSCRSCNEQAKHNRIQP